MAVNFDEVRKQPWPVLEIAAAFAWGTEENHEKFHRTEKWTPKFFNTKQECWTLHRGIPYKHICT